MLVFELLAKICKPLPGRQEASGRRGARKLILNGDFCFHVATLSDHLSRAIVFGIEISLCKVDLNGS